VCFFGVLVPFLYTACIHFGRRTTSYILFFYAFYLADTPALFVGSYKSVRFIRRNEVATLIANKCHAVT
jgi:hypothetical protein